MLRTAGAIVLLVLGLVLLGQTGQSPALPRFLDVTEEADIHFRHQASRTSQKYLLETMGAGVGWLDYDGDGLPDLYFVNGAELKDPMPKGESPSKSEPRYWNRLYRNSGNGKFVDVTESSGLRGKGYGMGVAVGDYDNDGNTDLYVTNFGENELYHNEGNGKFKDATDLAGVAAGGWSVGAVFLDYDRDGRLDLFVARYVDWSFQNNPWCGPTKVNERGYCHPNAFNAVTHLLYHNEGRGKFRDVSEKSGMATHPGKGLGVAVNDFNGDGWPDIFVANDSVAQQLFRNNGDGTFTDVALVSGVAYNLNGLGFAGMGVDFSDYNNDGHPDVFVDALALEGYVLFRNDEGSFEDDSGMSGITRVSTPHSGWGTKFIDYDNDGWKDLFVAQGHVMDTISIDLPQIRYREPYLLLRNAQRKFEDVSTRSGSAFGIDHAGRGVAFSDFNNDGYVDIIVNNNDERPVLLRNTGGESNWIAINTVGTVSNRDGTGARIRLVSASGPAQYGYASTASSYLSASDKRLHFGLGKNRMVELIEIQWPSRRLQQLENVNANQTLTVTEPK